jgi:hypothetical protein
MYSKIQISSQTKRGLFARFVFSVGAQSVFSHREKIPTKSTSARISKTLNKLLDPQHLISANKNQV